MPALELNPALLAHALMKVNLNPGIFQHGAKDLFIHMRLRAPVLRTVKIMDSIMSSGFHVEVTGVSADDRVMPQVCGRQATGDHPAYVNAGFKQYDMESLARRGISSHDPGSRASVN